MCANLMLFVTFLFDWKHFKSNEGHVALTTVTQDGTNELVFVLFLI